MYNADEVDQIIEQMKKDTSYCLSDKVWQTALACVGWSYVYGAWGALCTPSERRKRYSYHPEKTTIKTKCKNFDGNGTCNGCQWFPDGKRTRCYDCRGFTDWCLKQYGIDLYGDSVGVQWRTDSNWEYKGEIKDMPNDILVCLFVYKNNKWTHTGFGYGSMTCECSNGVEYHNPRSGKWTHFAVPKGIGSGGGDPVIPSDKKPTLRRGDKGKWVSLAQSKLLARGYYLGKCGIDGDFGSATEKAVKAFQKSNGLKQDGIIGEKTWECLDSTPVVVTYSITIRGLTKAQTDELAAKYPNSVVEEEGR